MKKLIFLLLVIFFIQMNKVNAEECIPNEFVTFEKPEYFIYEKGTVKPNYLDYIKAKDSCGNYIDVHIEDKYVNYDIEGEYKVYSYAKGKVDYVDVYVYENIPLLEGCVDRFVEINSDPPDYLNGVTATDIFKEEGENDLTANITVDDSKVNYALVGSYDLIYSVKDSRNNETVVVVKVHVKDETKPVITNAKSLTLPVHTNLETIDFWKDITVTDNSNREITKEIDKTGLNINVVGNYRITYKATDESGNTAQATVDVYVVDEIAPEIKNVIDLKILLNSVISKATFLNNIVVSDNYDTNISTEHLVVDYNLVKVNTPGIYQIFYFISDSSGNYTTKKALVTVYDEDIPQINNLQNIRVSVGTTSIDYLKNITATDLTDGDITNKLIIYDDNVNLDKVGEYKVHYLIIDSSGNEKIETITVTVYDDEAPVIDGVKNLEIRVNEPDTYNEEFFLKDIIVTDNVDTNLKAGVDLSSLDFSKLGQYTIIYFVEDTSGNITRINAIVTVIDDVAPVISGYDDITIVLNTLVDRAFLLEGISIIDNYDGDITESAIVSGFYDSKKVGSYQITIKVEDSSGNESEATFKLNVVSTTDDDGKKSPKNNYSIYYIIGGVSLTLILTGGLGYISRHKK